MSLANRYELLLDKSPGFERINTGIINVLKSDGWRPFDFKMNNKDFVVMRSNRNYHIFKNEVEVKKYLLRTGVKQKELDVIIVLKVKR